MLQMWFKKVGRKMIKKWCDLRWSLQKLSQVQMDSPVPGENNHSHLSHKGLVVSFQVKAEKLPLLQQILP